VRPTHSSTFSEQGLSLTASLYAAFSFPTPLPFLRLDSLALLIIWVLPWYTQKVVPNQISWAWKIAGIFAPMSIGWAAGDVSLVAFIQASLAQIEVRFPVVELSSASRPPADAPTYTIPPLQSEDAEVSALGAVMAFLYSTYIIIFAVAGSLLGQYVDKVFKEDQNITRALTNIGGVQFTCVRSFSLACERYLPDEVLVLTCNTLLSRRLASVISAIVLASSLIPKGAFSLNPKLDDELDMTADPPTPAVVEVGYTLKSTNTDVTLNADEPCDKSARTIGVDSTC
jgi:hypothetical protein